MYDRYGHAGVGGGGFGNGFGDFGFRGFDDIFNDVFGDIFGMGRRRTRGSRGADLRYHLTLDFNDAVFGVEAKIQIPRMVRVRHLRWRRFPSGDVTPDLLGLPGYRPGSHPARYPHLFPYLSTMSRLRLHHHRSLYRLRWNRKGERDAEHSP